MTKLTNEFKRWYKGGKVLEIAQGDDNLVVAIIQDSFRRAVGVWERRDTNHRPEKFRLIEITNGLSIEDSKRKFNHTVREF